MAKSWTLLGSNGQYVRRPLDAFLADMGELGLKSLDFVPQPPHLWLSHAEYEEPAPLLEKLADDAAARNAEFVSLYFGEDVSEETAQHAAEIFQARCPESEVAVLSGGQPVYYYIISME